jgi:hypothetical protein
MQTSRPWPPRSPSHRPSAVGEAAAGILTLPGGCLHDTAGARKAFRVSRMVVSFGYARFLRAVWTARPQQTHRTRSPGADHWHHHWFRRTTSRHDRRTAVPLGHHASDPCSQTDPICAPELMDAAVPAAAARQAGPRSAITLRQRFDGRPAATERLIQTNPNQDRQLAYQQVRPLSKITSTGVLNKPQRVCGEAGYRAVTR